MQSLRTLCQSCGGDHVTIPQIIDPSPAQDDRELNPSDFQMRVSHDSGVIIIEFDKPQHFPSFGGNKGYNHLPSGYHHCTQGIGPISVTGPIAAALIGTGTFEERARNIREILRRAIEAICLGRSQTPSPSQPESHAPIARSDSAADADKLCEELMRLNVDAHEESSVTAAPSPAAPVASESQGPSSSGAKAEDNHNDLDDIYDMT
jgi:hypothetical protein